MTGPYKISLCITCKGRLHHLKETLPQNLANARAYPNAEFVVLDYDSHDGLEQWIKQNYQAEIASGRLRYAKVDDKPHFHMTHAKNMAHRVATGDILCNLDADNTISNRFCDWLNTEFSKDPDIVARAVSDSRLNRLKRGKIIESGIAGRIAVHRDNFIKLRGYDEHLFKGWGPDDGNFEQRALAAGLRSVKIPYSVFGTVIQHDDAERIAHLSDEGRRQSEEILSKSRSIPYLTKRLFSPSAFMTKKRPIIVREQPPANTDGEFGCGTVRINFKEQQTLARVHDGKTTIEYSVPGTNTRFSEIVQTARSTSYLEK